MDDAKLLEIARWHAGADEKGLLWRERDVLAAMTEWGQIVAGECAKVCDDMTNKAKATWDDYTERCRQNPENIGSGSVSWHQYYEACAAAIRSTRRKEG